MLQDSQGEKIRISKWIGHQDNNVAEYVALLEALQHALKLKAKVLHVFSDSQVVSPSDDRRVRVSQPKVVLAPLDLSQAGPLL